MMAGAANPSDWLPLAGSPPAFRQNACVPPARRRLASKGTRNTCLTGSLRCSPDSSRARGTPKREHHARRRPSAATVTKTVSV